MVYFILFYLFTMASEELYKLEPPKHNQTSTTLEEQKRHLLPRPPPSLTWQNLETTPCAHAPEVTSTTFPPSHLQGARKE
jgi:hypothetical protein